MRRMGWAVVLAMAALGVAAKDAGPKPIDVAALAIEHETFTLDNGLRVVVHEDHSVPLVAVNFWYHVGSRNEKRGRTGFAHLFEHFFFNGSEHYPHGFREAMDDLGANNRNGTTNTDRTNFFEDVPTSALERTLYLEADRMGFLAGNLGAEMLERERGVVQNEKRQGENQPYGRVFTRMVEQMYPYSHPYSWSTIGSMDDLNAASLDDIKAWYGAWYGPNNAVLALAGDITVDQAKQLVGKYFGGIAPGQPVAKLKAWVPALDTDIRDTMEDRVPQTRIVRAWHVPQSGTRDLHALELYAGLLSGSESSPLDKRLVFGKQLATSVAAFAWGSELSGILMVQADVKPGVDPHEVEREIDAVIADTLSQPIDAAGLDRVLGSSAPLVLTDLTLTGGSNPFDGTHSGDGGGVFATASDYLKLLLMWRAHGKAGTQRLLNSATLGDMDRDHTVGTRTLSTPLPGGGYGLGHWIERKDANGHATLIASRGAFGFTPWIDTRRDIAGVLLVFGDNSTVGDDVTALIDQVAAVLNKDTGTVPFADFGGIWWRPQESGSGFTLVQRADHQLTGTFYTFDDAGEPLWLVFSGGQWLSSTRWRGSMHRTRYAGSGALSNGVDPARISAEAYGEIQFDFVDAQRGQLMLAFPQSTRTLAIERFPF